MRLRLLTKVNGTLLSNRILRLRLGQRTVNFNSKIHWDGGAACSKCDYPAGLHALVGRKYWKALR